MTDLQQKFDLLKKQIPYSTNSSPIWQKLNDHVSKMSKEQIAFVSGNELSVHKRKNLYDTFIAWLFELYKEDFVKVDQFKPLVEDYVDTVITTSQEYLQKQANLQRDNESLLKEVEELRKFKQQYEKVNEVYV